MSTRAIIAVAEEIKGYSTVWVWNDGSPDCLGRELRNFFYDEASIQELLELHSVSCICNETVKKDLMTDFPERFGGDDPEAEFIQFSNGEYAVMDGNDGVIVVGKAPYGHMDTIEEMLAQDLNYVYVFEDGKWTTYK